METATELKKSIKVLTDAQKERISRLRIASEQYRQSRRRQKAQQNQTE